MLQSLIRRVQGRIEGVVTTYVNRVVVAVPFILAAGFGTAALTVYLSQVFGPVTAYASLAAILFAVAGAVTAAVLNTNGAEQSALSRSDALAVDKRESVPIEQLFDRQMVIALLTRVAPIAVPAIVRMALGRRALFIVFLVIGGYFLFKNMPGWRAREEAEAAGAPAPAAS